MIYILKLAVIKLSTLGPITLETRCNMKLTYEWSKNKINWYTLQGYDKINP